MKKHFQVLLASILLSVIAFGQDAQFSQFYSAPLLINPALTGNTVQSRFTANYRNQWAGVPNANAFNSFAFGYEHNFENYNSGLGLMVFNDRAGIAGLSNTTVNLSYAYRLRITRHLSFKPGLQFGVGNRSLDFTQLVFNDQLQKGGGSSSAESQLESNSIYYMDVNAGGILYTKMMWLGLAVHHITQPDISLVGEGAKLPVKASLHGGYKVALKRNIKKKIISELTLAANYKHQDTRDQLDIGAYITYVPVVFGLWYRGIPVKNIEANIANSDAMIILLGYRKDGLALGYSYDFTISKLTTATSGGSHELSMAFEFASRKNQRKRRRRSRFMIPCPKF